MFPWLTGNQNQPSDHDDSMHGSDTDMADIADMDRVMDDYMMEEMEMGPAVSFTRRYKALSSDQLPESNLRTQIEFGVLMPQSALVQLSQHDMPSPLLFTIASDAGKTNCGVLEFSAPEGVVYVPPWMFAQLALAVGGMVTVRLAGGLPKGTFCKIQPQSVAFLDISDPRAVLEMAMRNYVVISKGDTIAFQYNDRQYGIAILEVKPADTVLVVETDLQVDFAAPVGYVEPDYCGAKMSSIAGSLETRDDALSPALSTFKAFSGHSNRLCRAPVASSASVPREQAQAPPAPSGPRELSVPKNTLIFSRQPKPPAPAPAPPKPDEKRTFTAFTGKPNKLN